MKLGMNLLLWTGGVTAEHFPLLAKLKAAGFDGVELPVFGGSPADYKPIRAELDKHFEQIVPQQIPGLERVQSEVRAQARKTLLAAGASENDLERMWSGDESIDLHSVPAQVITAKAALWDLAQEKARNVRQSNLPSVVKRGMYRSASDGDAQSVGELTARLAKATGREAIRLGTALTKARRAINVGR